MPMDRLKDKVIAVAGGAGRIGSELVARYAREGAAVMIGDLNEGEAQEVAERIRASGGKASAVAVDLAQEESVAAFVRRCEEAFGGMDGFHANAANFARSQDDIDVVEIEMGLFDDILHVNARGHALCARHAVPALLRRGGGVILFTSSGAAYVPDPGRVAYSMSKAAIHALMRHVALRWGHEGVRANVIAPGVIMHPKLEAKAPHLREWAMKRVAVNYLGDAADIAATAALLMSDEGRYITGQVLSIDGGSSMRQ
jgi:NAD(P)-dependent dehydrogenase (short-subunit alcohol dehydrogenase family)